MLGWAPKGRREVLDEEMGVELKDLEWGQFVLAQQVIVFQSLSWRESDETVGCGISVVFGSCRIGSDATSYGYVVLEHVEWRRSVFDHPKVLEAVALSAVSYLSSSS